MGVGSPRAFNELLIDAVDDVVTEILGKRGNSILWRHYQAFLGLTREEMPNQLPKLFSSLDSIFGVAGETVGERVIRKLYEKANVPLNYNSRRTPVEYAEELKEILAKDTKHLG